MDELAASASVLSMDTDAKSSDEPNLESTQGSHSNDAASTSSLVHSTAEKENQGDLPVGCGLEAENPKVMLRQKNHTFFPYAPPKACAVCPPCSQSTVESLLERARKQFPEGTTGPKSVAKCGAAAPLINKLIVHAKDAVTSAAYGKFRYG